MYPYIIIFVLTGTASALDLFRKKPSLVAFSALVVLLVVFAGIRFEAGFDYSSYFRNWWLRAQDMTNISMHQKEPVLFLMFHFLGSLGFSYNYALAAISALSIGLKAYVISKYSLFPFFGLLIFVGDFYLLQEMGQIRSGLAMGFLALSLHFLLNRRPLAFLSFYLLASATHVASIPFILTYYLVKNKTKPNLSIMMTSLGVLLMTAYFFLKPLLIFVSSGPIGQTFGLSSYALSALDVVEERSILTLGTAFSVSIVVIAFVFQNRLEQTMPFFREFFWVYSFGVAFLVVSLFLGDPAARVSRMFLFYQAILLPGFVALFRPYKISVFLIWCISLIYALSKYLLVLIGHWDAFVPYRMMPQI